MNERIAQSNKAHVLRTLLCGLLLAISGEATFAQGVKADAETHNMIGTWIGQWSSLRSGGRFEFEISFFDGQQMTGRVNSEAQSCTIGWTALSGRVVGDEIRGTYTIGPPCSRVDVVFRIPTVNVIEGKWTSQYPGYGTFRLTKQGSR
jgi:hypothetical protein